MKQWHYLSIEGVIFICCLLLYISICLYTKRHIECSFLWNALKWGIIILTGVECLWGMAQLYHFLPSFNPHFNITGSFPNPAPFSAYLILGLPICLNEYIVLKKKEIKMANKVKHLLLISILIVIFITLPSTMSRTAWMAAIVSSLFILEMHYHYIFKVKIKCFQNKGRGICYALLFGLFVFCIVFFVYSIKRDSAKGRMFLWKIELNTILENPLGYGMGKFPYAYKMSQEKYFSQKNVHFPRKEAQIALNMRLMTIYR